MKVRLYKLPYGPVEDLDVDMHPEEHDRVAALADRHIYPAIEMLRIPNQFSVTLEADDCDADLPCEVVRSEDVLATVRAMVRGFDVAAYDAQSAYERRACR